MKKTLHRFKVYTSDDVGNSHDLRWKMYNYAATRRRAWQLAKDANVSAYRHVKIVEERIYKGAD